MHAPNSILSILGVASLKQYHHFVWCIQSFSLVECLIKPKLPHPVPMQVSQRGSTAPIGAGTWVVYDEVKKTDEAEQGEEEDLRHSLTPTQEVAALKNDLTQPNLCTKQCEIASSHPP